MKDTKGNKNRGKIFRNAVTDVVQRFWPSATKDDESNSTVYNIKLLFWSTDGVEETDKRAVNINNGRRALADDEQRIRSISKDIKNRMHECEAKIKSEEAPQRDSTRSLE